MILEMLAIVAISIAVVTGVFAIIESRRRHAQTEATAAKIHGWLGNISGIRAAAELLREAQGKDEETNLVMGIAHAADRLRVSLETAMHDIRIGSGELHSHTEEVDAPALLQEIVEDLAPIARMKHIELTLRCVDIPASLIIDRTALEMSAFNVIENAIKYTEQGCVAVEVTISSDQLTLSVADTGCGLPENILNGTFQKYFRGDVSRSRGSGLGLYVVDQLVRAAGGSLRCCRRTDAEGSAVIVTLPVK